MNLHRRHFLRTAGAVSLAGLGATLTTVRDVQAAAALAGIYAI